jgi:lipopolysaccharide biosynthesis regulator YciM
MIRIIAILSEKIEEQKMKNKVNRVKNSIQAARLNAETDMMQIADKRIAIIESLKEKETPDVLEALVNCEAELDAVQKNLQYLDNVEKFLFEEIQNKK